MSAPQQREAGLRDAFMVATGRTAARSGWTERQLVDHMRLRCATPGDIAAALAEYRKRTR